MKCYGLLVRNKTFIKEENKYFCIPKPTTKHEAFKIKRVNTMIGQKISQKKFVYYYEKRGHKCHL